jgi:hypothetical protein
MNPNDAAKLLELLAKYAGHHGPDCAADMTVLDLADDLAASLAGEYAPAHVPEEWRDEVEAGFTGSVR